MAKLLQIDLNFSVSRSELETAWLQADEPIAAQPGLTWKVSLINEADQEAGGVYLFESEADIQTYLAGPICAALKSSPVISNISVKMFDVIEPHSSITRAPLQIVEKVAA